MRFDGQISGRRCGREFGLRDAKLNAAMWTINRTSGVSFLRLQLLTA